MAKVTVGEQEYKVLDNLGYVPDVGAYVKTVETETRKVVKRTDVWQFWTVSDRTQPLRDAIEQDRKKAEEG